MILVINYRNISFLLYKDKLNFIVVSDLINNKLLEQKLVGVRLIINIGESIIFCQRFDLQCHGPHP